MWQRSLSDSQVINDSLTGWNASLESNKIRMVIDVPFTDHPYLIGPRGRKCQQLMDKYDVFIHFPDVNRNAKGPKINHVMLYGSARHVEDIRRELRDRIPVRVCTNMREFEKPNEVITKVESVIQQNSRPVSWRLAEDMSSCIFKTELRSYNYLTEIIDHCITPLRTDTSNLIFMIGTPLLPLLNVYNEVLSQALISHVFKQFGSRIFYPPSMSDIWQAPFYFIQGPSVDGIIKAYRFLMGLTMCQIIFILPEDTEVTEEQIEYWRETFLVEVSVESSYDRELSKSIRRVSLRFFEFCIKYAYLIRTEILNIRSVVSCTSYKFMEDVRPMISSDVFDNAQLFFPLFSDIEIFEGETTKTGHEIFTEFYGKIPRELRSLSSASGSVENILAEINNNSDVEVVHQADGIAIRRKKKSFNAPNNPPSRQGSRRESFSRSNNSSHIPPFDYGRDGGDLADDVFEPNYTYDVPEGALFVVVNPEVLPPHLIPLLEVCVFMRHAVRVFSYMIPLPTFLTTDLEVSLNRIVYREERSTIHYSIAMPPRFAFSIKFLSTTDAARAVKDCYTHFIVNARSQVPQLTSKQDAMRYLAEHFGFPSDPGFILILLDDGIPTYMRLNPRTDCTSEFDLDPYWWSFCMTPRSSLRFTQPSM